MPLDTATLALSGEVPFDQFVAALRRFHDLIDGLTVDMGAASVSWVIDDLSVGSALAAVRGIGPTDLVEAVVTRYGEVGVVLEAGRTLPATYSPRVRRAAYELRKIPGGKVDTVMLQTPEREVILRPVDARRAKPTNVVRLAPAPLEGAVIRQGTGAHGAIEGRVQTLSNRGGLRFTLYDTLNDKAVSCYLAEGHEEIMRDAWGQRAVVEGFVSRDPVTGRPLAVRRVRKVTVLPERERSSYQMARGAAPSLTGMSAEAAIRRLRDA